jgi:hypothetical protein
MFPFSGCKYYFIQTSFRKNLDCDISSVPAKLYAATLDMIYNWDSEEAIEI